MKGKTREKAVSWKPGRRKWAPKQNVVSKSNGVRVERSQQDLTKSKK